MVAEGQDQLFNAWWLVTFPGLAIALTVLALNLVASWLRVAADPQQREKQLRRRLGPTAGPVVERRDAETPLLEVDDLRVEFSTPAARARRCAASRFDARRGETLGLVGESGSGKSVTAHAVLGLIDDPGRIAGGDIRWQVGAVTARASAVAHARRRRSRWSSRTR